MNESINLCKPSRQVCGCPASSVEEAEQCRYHNTPSLPERWCMYRATDYRNADNLPACSNVYAQSEARKQVVEQNRPEITPAQEAAVLDEEALHEDTGSPAYDEVIKEIKDSFIPT